MLNGEQIPGETALGPLTDIGHHPHFLGRGVVAPEFVAVDAVVRCEVQGVLDADAHALIGDGLAPRCPRSCIANEADPLVTAVGGLVVNFTGFQHAVAGRSAVVTVVQTEGHETPARRTTVGFAEADGIAEHHARCATAGAATARTSVGAVLAVCTVAHVHGFVDLVDGKVGVAVVIDANMESDATIDAKLAGVLDEGLNEGGLAVHTVRSVATVCAISTVGAVRTIGSVQPVHAIETVGAVLAREALRPCLAGSAVVSINAVADASG